MTPNPDQDVAVVVGATGGIGAALVRALAAQGRRVHALSRRGQAAAGAQAGVADIEDEASLRAAAAAIGAPIGLLLVATGRLQGEGAAPERRLSELDAEGLAAAFRVNTIGPALVAKHFAPLMPRDRRAAMGVLSARVGSVTDNRLGGWYGYRASKAAVNMVVRCTAVELARTHPLAVVAALHPGTVDTALSRPFQRGERAGSLFTPDHAASRLLSVLDALEPRDSGGFFAHDGSAIPF